MDVCLAHMTEIKVVVSLILGFFCCRAVVKGCNREPEISESEEHPEDHKMEEEPQLPED